MKRKNGFLELAILLWLFISIIGGYAIGRSLWNAPAQHSPNFRDFYVPGLPPLTKLDIPPQTVDGITAILEGGYADPDRVAFVVSFSNDIGNFQYDQTFLANEQGEQINLAAIWLRLASVPQFYLADYMMGPLNDVPSSTYLIDFHPSVPLDEERLNGQFSVAFTLPTDASHIVAFRFNLDMPVHPTMTFNLGKTISIDGVGILLDRLIIAPAYTFAYVCYPNRSDENWILTGEHLTLNINGLTSNPGSRDWLFDSTIIEGEQEQFSEPGWTPPNQESRCEKLGFPIGDAHPTFLTLILPGLEDAMTTVVPGDRLSMAYEKLLAQGIDMKWISDERGTFAEYKSLPEGMTEKEAYHHFMDALRYLHEGPWVFRILLFQ